MSEEGKNRVRTTFYNCVSSNDKNIISLYLC